MSLHKYLFNNITLVVEVFSIIYMQDVKKTMQDVKKNHEKHSVSLNFLQLKIHVH